MTPSEKIQLAKSELVNQNHSNPEEAIQYLDLETCKTPLEVVERVEFYTSELDSISE